MLSENCYFEYSVFKNTILKIGFFKFLFFKQHPMAQPYKEKTAMRASKMDSAEPTMLEQGPNDMIANTIYTRWQASQLNINEE